MLRDFGGEGFDVVVVAGQSNAEGYGYGETEEAFVGSDDIWQMTRDFTIHAACENIRNSRVYMHFGLTFATDYIKNGYLASGRKVLILRSAVGGTGFADKRWGLEDDLYLTMNAMIDTVLKLNASNRIVAVLWHQGCTDAILLSTQETYANNLSNLIKGVREKLGSDKVPFIAADYVPVWRDENIGIVAPIMRGTQAALAMNKNTGFVESNGLACNGTEDTIHFSRDALVRLGHLYYDKYVEITK